METFSTGSLREELTEQCVNGGLNVQVDLIQID